MTRWHFGVAAVVIGLSAGAAAQNKQEASNMDLLAHNDLQARSAYAPVIHRQGDRYIAYVGHHGGRAMNPLTKQEEPNGTSVLDVTNPRQPRYLFHIPGEAGAGEQGGAQMARVCNGATLPNADRSKVYLLRSFGNSGHEVWDVTVPEKPAKVSTVVSDLRNTHKNFWECDTGIAYLVSGDKAWRTRRMTKIYDLSNPAAPKFIRDYGVHGQQPGSTGTVPTELHGPISLGVKANRVYFAHGTGSNGLIQIVDREKLLNGPKEPTQANLMAPEVSRLVMTPWTGAHTTFPMPKMPIAEFARDKDGGTRDIVMIVNESILNECLEARQMVWFADLSIENRPMMVSNWTVPEASGNFCTRGGRFGAHSSNEDMGPPYYQKLTFVTFFNAGVRVLDIRNPYQPKEVGYFIPPISEATSQRCGVIGGKERCSNATIQSNNAETDDRGYIYVADRSSTGLHILELTGEARAIAGLPPN
jgi:hypothetical protein